MGNQMDISIYNTTGEKVWQDIIMTHASGMSLQTQLPPGAYILKTLFQGTSFSKKILIH